jgi:tRNA(Ile)-lysidine synthase
VIAAVVGDFLSSRGLGGTTGVVALSGGPDSVALAAVCRSLLASGEIEGVHLAHLNHGLRGAESDADERFVRELAESWKLPIAVARRDITGPGIEETARRVRYDWLGEVAHQHSAAWIATGHNADDQAETVLHHILRGTGLSGLVGIAADRPVGGGVRLVRPLLSVTRAEILAYLVAEKIAYRVDSSNADVRFTRNRIRHDLLPMLAREYNPAIVEVLQRLGRQADDWHRAITQRVAELLAEIERPRAGAVIVLARPALAELDAMWIREIARAVWRREHWPQGAMTFDDWDRVVQVARGELPRHDFPDGVRARATPHVV